MVPKRVPINHPLGLIWHPLEGAGRYLLSTNLSTSHHRHHICTKIGCLPRCGMVRTQRPVEALQIFTASELRDMNLQGEPERISMLWTRCSHCNNNKTTTAFTGCWKSEWVANHFWLVVSTHLKNISPNGSFPQIGMKIKNIWNHHLHNEYLVAFILDKPTGWNCRPVNLTQWCVRVSCRVAIFRFKSAARKVYPQELKDAVTYKPG